MVARGEADLVRLRALLESYRGVMAVPSEFDGMTLLSSAAQRARVDVVRVLVELGDDLERPARGRPPVAWAVRGGSREIVVMLLENGASVDVKSLLSDAAQSGDVEILRMLVDAGAELYRSPELLHAAAENGDGALVSAAIELGAPLELNSTRFGGTALAVACWRGNSAAVEVLLERGSDVNSLGDVGRSPLHLAAHAGHASIVSKLLAAGASADRVDILGGTALHLASEEGHRSIVASILQDGSVDVNAANEYGWTALHKASAFGHVGCVRTLVDHPLCSTGARTLTGRTPLELAERLGMHDVLAFLRPISPTATAGSGKGEELELGVTGTEEHPAYVPYEDAPVVTVYVDPGESRAAPHSPGRGLEYLAWRDGIVLAYRQRQRGYALFAVGPSRIESLVEEIRAGGLDRLKSPFAIGLGTTRSLSIGEAHYTLALVDPNDYAFSSGELSFVRASHLVMGWLADSVAGRGWSAEEVLEGNGEFRGIPRRALYMR